MSEFASFKDFNFKLMVINKLMYEQSVLQPRFDLRHFAKKYTARQIDIDKEGYEIIPEVKEYFASLPIRQSDVESIEELYQDGGNEIYLQLCPYWDGEDDRFNIESAADAALLPRLKQVTLFYDRERDMLAEFVSRGVQARWL